MITALTSLKIPSFLSCLFLLPLTKFFQDPIKDHALHLVFM